MSSFRERMAFLCVIGLLLAGPAWAASVETPTVKLGAFEIEAGFQLDDMRLEDGNLRATCFGFDPYMYINELAIDAHDVKGIEVRMRTNKDGRAQLFWESDKGSWSESRSVQFLLVPDNTMRTYTIPVSESENWAGTIKRLRFDPSMDAMTQIEIESIHLLADLSSAENTVALIRHDNQVQDLAIPADDLVSPSLSAAQELSADAPFVALSGTGLYTNPDEHVDGYIKEIRSPLVITLKHSDKPFVATLTPVEEGHLEPIAGSRAPDPMTVSSAGGSNNTATIDFHTKERIGVYDLSVTSDGLADAYANRLYFVEAATELAKMRDVSMQDDPLYGDPRKVERVAVKSFDYETDIEAATAGATMTLYETDLFPGWILNVNENTVTFFDQLKRMSLGQPSYYAMPTATGVKVMSGAESSSGDAMSEPWVLFWFAGADGWTAWDVPTLVIFEKKPQTFEPGEDGFTVMFDANAGHIVYLPLYGAYRPPQEGEEMLSDLGLPERGIETWTWSDGLPEAVRERCSWWARYSRRVPIDCDETFNVDPASGLISVRQKYAYLDIEDAWGTEPLQAAPLSPNLGFTVLQPEGFPITFEQEITDLEYMTPYGPYMVAEGAETIDFVVDRLLDIVNHTEIQRKPNLDTSAAEKAYALLRKTMWRRFQGGPMFMVEYDRTLFVWAQLAEHCFPKALAYSDPVTQIRMKGGRVNYYNTFFFGTRDHPADGGRGWMEDGEAKGGDRGWWRHNLAKGRNPKPQPVVDWFLENTIAIDGPGIHGGVMSDSGKISASAINNLWNYAHYTGDWNLIRRRWGFILDCETNSVNMDWKAMGRQTNAEGGEHMPPVLALARLGYMAGDLDTYYWASYLFMREALMIYVKQREVGGVYFRERQPYTTPDEVMDEWALPSHVLGEMAGWMLDAKNYKPIIKSEQQTKNRWVRFASEDASRLWRDNATMREWTREELEALQSGALWVDSEPLSEAASFSPSYFRLYSYLLDTPADKLVEMFPQEDWDWSTDHNGTVLMAHALLRNTTDRLYRKLIPETAPASGFVTGLARVPVIVNWRGLTCFRWPGREVEWPRTRWYKRGGVLKGDHRDFTLGNVRPGERANPDSIETHQLSWTTHVVVFK